MHNCFPSLLTDIPLHPLWGYASSLLSTMSPANGNHVCLPLASFSFLGPTQMWFWALPMQILWACVLEKKNQSNGAKLGWDGYPCYDDDDDDVEHTHKTLASPITPVCVIDTCEKKKKKSAGDGTSWQQQQLETKNGAGVPLIIITFSAGYELLTCKAP